MGKLQVMVALVHGLCLTQRFNMETITIIASPISNNELSYFSSATFHLLWFTFARWFCKLQVKFVADAMSAIASNCDVPVSVKCRIGVDDKDSYNELCKCFPFITAAVLGK